MQIRTTVRCHLTPVKVAIVRKSTNNKRSRGHGGKGTFLHCWWECKLVQSLGKTICMFLKKLRIELPYGLAIALLDVYSKKMKAWYQRDIYTFIEFSVVLFIVAKIWKQSKCPSIRRCDVRARAHTHTHTHTHKHTHDGIFSHDRKSCHFR